MCSCHELPREALVCPPTTLLSLAGLWSTQGRQHLESESTAAGLSLKPGLMVPDHSGPLRELPSGFASGEGPHLLQGTVCTKIPSCESGTSSTKESFYWSVTIQQAESLGPKAQDSYVTVGVR